MGHDRRMADLQVHQALVLQILPFQDEHLIVTLFTHRLGLIKTLIKYRRKVQPPTLLEPLSWGEFTLYKQKSDLYHFREGTLLDNHFFLRTHLSILQAAGKMISALLKTQLPEKPAGALLALILSFFQLLPIAENPQSIVAIFYLKLLKHEGLLQTNKQCAGCGIPINHFLRYQGELYCKEHAPLAHLIFDATEEETLLKISESKKSKELLEKQLSSECINKIYELFEQTYI